MLSVTRWRCNCAFYRISCPPFPVEVAKAEVEKELGQTCRCDLFGVQRTGCRGVNCAGAQSAADSTGEEVAVKVLRPGIEKAFQKDVDAFYLAARMVELFSPGSRRLRPMDVIEHFDGVVQGELDLRLESSAASEYAANTKDDAGFRTACNQMGLFCPPRHDPWLGRRGADGRQ